MRHPAVAPFFHSRCRFGKSLPEDVCIDAARIGNPDHWWMVRAAQFAGVEHIRLSAAGGRSIGPVFGDQRWDGYWFWPSLSFDGSLTEFDRTFFRVNFWLRSLERLWGQNRKVRSASILRDRLRKGFRISKRFTDHVLSKAPILLPIVSASSIPCRFRR